MGIHWGAYSGKICHRSVVFIANIYITVKEPGRVPFVWNSLLEYVIVVAVAVSSSSG